MARHSAAAQPCRSKHANPPLASRRQHSTPPPPRNNWSGGGSGCRPVLIIAGISPQILLAAYLGAVTRKFVWRERQPAGGGRAPDGMGAISAADQQAIAAMLEDARRRHNSTGNLDPTPALTHD